MPHLESSRKSPRCEGVICNWELSRCRRFELGPAGTGERTVTSIHANSRLSVLNITDSVNWVKRSYYSITWLQASDVTREQAVRIGEGDLRPDPADYEAMKGFVLSAVTAAAAFLEAHINEWFDDAHTYLGDPASKLLGGLREETQQEMAKLWPDIKRKGTFDKYDRALALDHATALERGSEPAQSALLLGRIRNHYLHYQPDSVRDGVAEGADRSLSKQLKGRIAPPIWDSSVEDLFPSRALCPDLARWAVESSLSYADAFCDALGVDRRYDHMRPVWMS